MIQKKKKKISFDNKKKHIIECCCYGEEWFCDGTVNKSIEGWEARIRKRPCKKKPCPLKKETIRRDDI